MRYPNFIREYENSGMSKSDHYDWYRSGPVVNGFVIPEPMREAPAAGTHYYLVNTAHPRSPQWRIWEGTEHELELLRLGLCHLEKEAAHIHLEALVSFTR